MHMSVKPGGGRVVKWFRGLRQIHVVYMTLGSKKKISKKFDIGLLLNQNCLGSLTKIIFSPSAVSMKIRLLHPVEQDYLDPLYLLVSFKEHCSSIPVSISAVYRCLECLPF